MSKPDFKSVSGYDAWYNANYPKLRDYSIYSKGAAIWNAARAAPAVANGASELPPLPKAEAATDMHVEGRGRPAFTAEQMRDYARAAIAASTQRAAPKQALTDAYILAQWEVTREEGGFYMSMVIPGDAAIIAFARAIEAASAPNALLVAALKDITQDYAERFDLESPSTNPGIKHVIEQALAALASVPTVREK